MLIWIRGVFVRDKPDRQRHAHRGPASTGFHRQLAANLFHPLLHTGNADARFERESVAGFLVTSVADFNDHLACVAAQSYRSLCTSRMPVDVGQALLNDPK